MKKLYMMLMVLFVIFAFVACSANHIPERPAEMGNVESPIDVTQHEQEDSSLLLKQVTWEHLTQKTLPEEGAWLKETDQVSLVAAIEDKDIYLYCLHNGHPWGGEGVVLQYGEMFQTYPLCCLVKYSYPVLESGDIDADGEEELLLIMGRSGGTGLYIEDLYVFEPGDEGYTCVALESAQIAALINEQVSFGLSDNGILRASCQAGTETNMMAAQNETMLVDRISFDVEADTVTLNTPVQVINEDGQWKYLCDYIDDPTIDKKNCVATEYIHTVEAEVAYDGQAFSLVNLHFEEAERVE